MNYDNETIDVYVKTLKEQGFTFEVTAMPHEELSDEEKSNRILKVNFLISPVRHTMYTEE